MAPRVPSQSIGKTQLILAKTLRGKGGVRPWPCLSGTRPPRAARQTAECKDFEERKTVGGFGSGNWSRWNRRKSTVEESLVLAVRDLRKQIPISAAGTLTWTWTTGRTCSVGYFVTWQSHGPIVTLHYRWDNREDVAIPIPLQTTLTQFGGERRWFTCPLIARGVACNRRVGKLYLPPGARYFGCRTCHDLSYSSAQKAHASERLFASLDRDFAALPAAVRRAAGLRRRACRRSKRAPAENRINSR